MRLDDRDLSLYPFRAKLSFSLTWPLSAGLPGDCSPEGHTQCLPQGQRPLQVGAEGAGPLVPGSPSL